ncbi:mycofactocin biosynthesis peptidyl-dipeptidase MftE [Nocardia coubleae]|uniref:Mycofactocin biosynthesis peptidyl-dipeptidase MftE n=1 Tax=Nocardia coubleae TaxID=356147 RepID=A0A846W9A7_9NOCA|nr:mycofactocin biosynthesis peptidyl-dipeptidase MftE [Nocardia coubleae]NKX89989.1 mycofactocin biosynthesis peptidyl-dipeptidase MftE [Nocardia coubleae]
MFVAQLTSPEVDACRASILLVPLGAIEQHGPHLPLSTDLDIASALCARAAAARHDVLVAPAVPYGASGEHAGFAGTLSIGQAALELLVVELCRSATATFERIVLVNAHGGNVEALRRAVTLLRSESRDVRLFCPGYGGDAHAGHTETSLQLALAPDRVRTELAEPGDTRPLAEVLPLLRTGGVAAVSNNGILGDPTGANAAAGTELLSAATAALLHDLGRWWPGDNEEGPRR